MRSSLVIALAALCASAPAAWAEEEFPEFAKVTEGMTTLDGFVKLHRKEKEEELLGSIAPAMVGKPFFLATSVAGGSDFAGWQWADKLVQFEQRNKQLMLIELNTQQRTSKGDSPLAEVVRRTYTDRLLATIDIKTMGPGGEFVVDLGGLLAGSYETFFGGSFSLDASVARFTKVKTFPQNVEIAIRMPLRGDGTFMTLHYSISELPEAGDYTARKADDRIGYFHTAIRDYTDGDPIDGRMVRLINRWKVEKLDASLASSPAKEPIIFYIEKSVPVMYRRAVAAGISEWNRAFEALGIHGAIEVRQQTETRFADLDPEDVRYNFFRWITSETPFAMGPSRVDPRTGRILDADIIFDDSMLRGSIRDYQVMIREAPNGLMTKPMADLVARRPDLHPMARFREQMGDAPTRVQAAARELQGAAKNSPALEQLVTAIAGEVTVARTAAELSKVPAVIRQRAERCQVGAGLPHQVAFLRLCFGGLARELGAAAPPGFDDYLGEVVKETVMHEVGHTLGLRHNFKASSLMDLDAMNSEGRPAATSASVMDYHPLNIALGTDKPQGHFSPQTIGAYDLLAIKYGYSFVEEGSDDLKKIPREMAEQGLPYGTDEDAASPDPMITRWDMGNDPIKFARYRQALVKKLWENLEARAVADDESYSRLRKALDMTVFELGMSGYFVARQVGGIGFTRDHKGDPKARPPVQVTDAAAQRAALRWVCENVFADGSLAVPPALMTKLAAGRWSDWASGDESLEYSLLDRIGQVQGWSLAFLTNDDVLARLWENEQRVGKDGEGVSLPELFDTIEAAVFTEVTAKEGAAAPSIGAIRQNLQDVYVRRLIAIALGNGIAPPVANKLAWSRLKGLEARFEGCLAGKLDPYTRAHLESLEAKSNAARGAEYVHIASGGCALAPVGSGRTGGPIGAVAFGALALAALVLRRRAA